MLRPFDGNLYEDNFHELITILKTLKQHFRDEKINRQIMSPFWGICYFSKAWGLAEEGMLRSNNLLSNKQIEQLSVWVDCISYAIMGLLDGMDDEHAFEFYNLYLKDKSE